MRIYVCVPDNVFSRVDFHSAEERLRLEFWSALKGYYGDFARSDIAFSAHNHKEIHVYIMEKAHRSGVETHIKRDIEKIIRNILPGNAVDIRLNYQAFNPNFRPDVPEPSPEATDAAKNENNKLAEFDYNKLSLNYRAEEPHYSFEQVILPKPVLDQIMEAVGTIQVAPKVFDEWGLRNIIPYATSAMSFYGPPGTGKTMAAEAVAHRLGKKIIRATYADIESKFHGEGPKMVKAIFRAAEREDAVLFLDESDSLLSKRLTNVTDGSAQAINSMRSQLLICLEQFQGIVIFATNLVVNYDKAFLSRLVSIEFPMPDAEARKVIWQQHIKGDGVRIPLSEDVNLDELAEKYVFCGREIKNAVKDACVTVALRGGTVVSQDDFLKSCEKTRAESEKVLNASDHTQSGPTLTPQQNDALKEALQKKLAQKKKAEEL